MSRQSNLIGWLQVTAAVVPVCLIVAAACVRLENRLTVVEQRQVAHTALTATEFEHTRESIEQMRGRVTGSLAELHRWRRAHEDKHNADTATKIAWDDEALE